MGWALLIRVCLYLTVWSCLPILCNDLLSADHTIDPLPPPQVNQAEYAIQRRVDQLNQLMDLGETEEALDQIIRLLDRTPQSGQWIAGQWVTGQEGIAAPRMSAVSLGEGRFISLQEYCQRLLVRLPMAERARYRQQVDPVAKDWYTRGIARRDEPLLRRLVDQMFLSQWGDKSLLALGEMALERADYQQARVDWLRIGTNWPTPQENPPSGLVSMGLLVYPDSDLDQAMLWARLVLVSIRARQFARAQIEIDQLRRVYPQANGKLGGKNGNYTRLLAQLLEETIGGTSLSVAAYENAKADQVARPLAARPALGIFLQQKWTLPLVGKGVTSLPTIAGKMLCFSSWPSAHPLTPDEAFPVTEKSSRSGAQVHVVELSSGKPTTRQQSKIFTFQRALSVQPASVGTQKYHAAQYEAPVVYLTSDSGRFLWCTQVAVQQNTTKSTMQAGGRNTNHFAGTDSRGAGGPLVGFDLHRDGALYFRQWPADARWTYSGPPRVSRVPVSGRCVLVAMIERGLSQKKIGIACYQADSERLLWHQVLCDLPTIPQLQPEIQEPPIMLTLVGSVVYCNTNHGLVAALRVDDGQLLWMATYRRSMKALKATMLGDQGEANRCLFFQGNLLLAPADSCELLALDAASGLRIWSQQAPSLAVNLLGVIGDRLILSGNRLWAIDRTSGERIPEWGDKTAGWCQPISEAGKGLIDGQTIYWPAQGKIWTLDGSHGRPTALTIESNDVEPVSELPQQARLLMSDDKLIAAGAQRITVYQLSTRGSNGELIPEP